jgi:hypothetical protein
MLYIDEQDQWILALWVKMEKVEEKGKEKENINMAWPTWAQLRHCYRLYRLKAKPFKHC